QQTGEGQPGDDCGVEHPGGIGTAVEQGFHFFASALQKPWALRKGWRASCSRRVMPSARMALIRAEKDWSH
ncbi:hypothetical protein, partial [Klebsiella pneumoniae]|uniref:hypothetical protein n=1 Tax=Klebsiella pneumoniae TaxID=573 RepID=UPI003968171A